MNLSKLFEMQKALDERIVREKGLEGQDLLPMKILALQVELGELANEWRGFKVWSNDREPRREKKSVCSLCQSNGKFWIIAPNGKTEWHDCHKCGKSGYIVTKPLLEEYVDCLHFILSIANQVGYTDDDLYTYEDTLSGTTTDNFNELFAHLGQFCFAKNDAMRRTAFRIVVYVFFNMGEQRFGFTWEQIEQAYIAKNAVNHERQVTGY